MIICHKIYIWHISLSLSQTHTHCLSLSSTFSLLISHSVTLSHPQYFSLSLSWYPSLTHTLNLSQSQTHSLSLWALFSLARLKVNNIGKKRYGDGKKSDRVTPNKVSAHPRYENDHRRSLHLLYFALIAKDNKKGYSCRRRLARLSSSQNFGSSPLPYYCRHSLLLPFVRASSLHYVLSLDQKGTDTMYKYFWSCFIDMHANAN